MFFKDRVEAGQKLAETLKGYENAKVVVYALPRGGVVLGYEIAKALKAPLDLVITRKIGHPLQSEYAICAVTESGNMICNEEEKARIDKLWLAKEAEKERQEAKRRHLEYLGGRQRLSAKGKIAIIVDDGVATGLTIKLAMREIKGENPRKIIVAVPVVPKDIAAKIRGEADLVALEEAEYYLGAVGAYYDDFPQVEDEEVINLISELRQ